MKAQSKKTFKFRKTRGRRGEAEEGAGAGVATIEGTIVEQSPPLPTATATTQTPTMPRLNVQNRCPTKLRLEELREEEQINE